MHERTYPCRFPGHGYGETEDVVEQSVDLSHLPLLKIIGGNGSVAGEGFIIGRSELIDTSVVKRDQRLKNGLYFCQWSNGNNKNDDGQNGKLPGIIDENSDKGDGRTNSGKEVF